MGQRGRRILLASLLGPFSLGLVVAAIVLSFATVGTNVPVAGAGISGALAAIGLGAFLGFYVVEGSLRTAITASTIITYLMLISFTLNSGVQHAFSTDAGKQLLTSFTAAVSVVVAFYFGGRAVETLRGKADSTPAPGIGGTPPKDG